MQQKKIPIRMCAGCGEHFPKKELVRIVRSSEGEISLDLTGRKPGRGVYICRNTDCLKKVKKSGKMERSLECDIPDDVMERLEEELNN